MKCVKGVSKTERSLDLAATLRLQLYFQSVCVFKSSSFQTSSSAKTEICQVLSEKANRRGKPIFLTGCSRWSMYYHTRALKNVMMFMKQSCLWLDHTHTHVTHVTHVHFFQASCFPPSRGSRGMLRSTTHTKHTQSSSVFDSAKSKTVFSIPPIDTT